MTESNPSPPPTQPQASAPAEVSLSSAGAIAAVLSGLLWAILATGGAPFTSLLAATAGGALTLLVCLVAWRGVEASGRWGKALVQGAAGGLPLLVLLGALLVQRTHHRPLGAVTFTIGALVVLTGAWLVAGRLRWSTRMSVLSSVAAVAAVVALTRDSVFDGASLQVFAGLGLAVACIWLDGNARGLPRRIAAVLGGAVVVANLAILTLGVPREAQETAPVVLGLLGLLS